MTHASQRCFWLVPLASCGAPAGRDPSCFCKDRRSIVVPIERLFIFYARRNRIVVSRTFLAQAFRRRDSLPATSVSRMEETRGIVEARG